MPRLPFLLVLVLVSSQAFGAERPAAPSLRFTRNDGQWDKHVLYRAALPGGFLFVKKQSLQYVFYDTKAVARQHPGSHREDHAPGARTSAQGPSRPGPGTIRAHGFEVQFGGAGGEAELLASGQTPERRNYLLGNQRGAWASNVPSFGEIRYRNLYPGIDLRLFAQQGTAKYEFIVSPGADPARIRLVYEGMSGLALKDGFLVTTTTVNTMTETPPYCFQEGKNGRQQVASQFALAGNTLSFRFPEGYRRALPLVIDPYLVFSTYSGSFSDNWGFTATYDEAGNLYSGGIEFGNRFPATNGAFQTTFAGNIDVAVLKYNPEGSALLYATYLGGEEADVPHSLVVNAANELIVFGTTSSTQFPVSATAYDRDFGIGGAGGTLNDTLDGIKYASGSDLFVSRLNAAGDALAASTYLGGSGNDGLNEPGVSGGIAIRNYGDQFRGEVNVDAAGNIYVASNTASADFPVTNGTTRRGEQDGVVVKFAPDLATLRFSTYFGGDGLELANGIRISKSGAMYVCGPTTSPDLATAPGVLKTTLGGEQDGYVARFPANGGPPLVSYLGTDGIDHAYLIDLDASENVYVMGLTYGEYPVTAAYSQPGAGQFIHAFDSTFTQTVFSTTIGSGRRSPDISPTAFMVSDCGFIYLTGWGGTINRRRGERSSSTRGLPVTPDALRGITNGDDFYLAILGANANSLLYATFFGSPNGDNHVDGGTSRFRKDGTIYHAVCACRDNSQFPTTPGVWSRVNNGDAEDFFGATSDGCNNLAFKFALDGIQAGFESRIEGCAGNEATFTSTSQGARTYQWEVNGQPVPGGTATLAYTFDQPGEYDVTLRVFNPATCKHTDEVTQKVQVLPVAPLSVSPNVRVCLGDMAQLRAGGGVQYEWLPATGLDNPASPTPIARPGQTTDYRVRITNALGCVRELTTRVEVTPSATAAFDVMIASECGKPNRVKLVNKGAGAVRYQWLLGDSSVVEGENPEAFAYTRPGEYEVVLRAFNGVCVTTFSQRIRVEDPKDPPNVITPNGDGYNEVFELPNPGWKLEVYDRWGKHVYSSAAYYNDWGGDVRGGVYFYRITSPLGASCKGWLHVLK